MPFKNTHRGTALAFWATSVLALALTACGPKDPTAPGPTQTPAAPAPTTAPPKPAPAPSKPSPSSSPSADAPPPPSPTVIADVFPCTTADVTFTATLAEPTTSSYLLKITNKTGKPCNALHYPIVTFGDLDGQAEHREETHPGTPITLNPGESAYAGLMGGVKTGKSKTVDSIAMTMDTATSRDQTPATAPTPGLNVSPEASVTAWQNNVEDALSL